MNFGNWKPHCHSLGYIMVNKRGKSPMQRYNEASEKYSSAVKELKNFTETTSKDAKKAEANVLKYGTVRDELEKTKDAIWLSDTCKTHLANIRTELKYNRTEDIKNKYLEKGLQLEEDAITAYSILKMMFHKKNKETRENLFIIGETDLAEELYVGDTKVNWSIHQYGRLVAKPINPIYRWQLKGYCILWGKKKGKLIYVLLDTPEHLIQNEIKKLKYDFVGTDEDFNEACIELRRNHVYGDIPDEDKVKIFDVTLDDGDEDMINQRVIECRRFLQQIEDGVSAEAELEDEEVEEAA